MTLDLITPFIGLGLTLLVFSYLLGDNPPYRFVVNFLAGLSLAYLTLLALSNVIVPQVILPLVQAFSPERTVGQFVGAAISLVFGALILFKLSPRLAPWGNLGMAVLIGVGAGVAVGGALLGSLIGLTLGAANVGSLADPIALAWGVLALFATISVLMYFWYTGRAGAPGASADPRAPVIRALAGIGQFFLMITFGALFGGALVAGIATLTNRLDLFATTIAQFFQ